ncbi:Uncharacterised protein [Mycobacteroides abscessus subsp. abscessus]|nr:Uncharacterised protein [Mycobacteroides abscessus subsp. abscessus]
MAVHEQLGHGVGHRIDLVLLAGEGRDQLAIMQAGRHGGETNLHERHRVRRELQERGVPVVDSVADAVGEVDAVAQPLLPVVDIVDRLGAGPDQLALVHRRVVGRLQRVRFDALDLRGQLAQQRVHLLRVAGALGLHLAGELALGFGAGDDRVDLLRGTADDGLGRGGVDAHLEAREVGEDRLDLLGRVLDERHQADVLAEQHGLALTHEVCARADGAGGVGQRQTTGEVGGGRLTERLANHRTGFRTVRLEQLAECDLQGEDHGLDDLDGVFAGLVGVVDGVIEDQLDDGVAALVLDVRVDLVDPLREDRVVQVQALAHLAVLRTETGEHPHRTVGDRAVGGQHQRALLALGQGPQPLYRFVVVVRENHCARTAVVAARQRTADGLQRVGPALLTVDPVRQLRRGSLLA